MRPAPASACRCWRPVPFGSAKGGVLALIARHHQRIVDAEVADMGLVDDDVLRRVQRGLHHRVPTRRLEIEVVQVDDLAELAIRRQADGVGVGDLVIHQLLHGRRVDRQCVAVVHAVPAAVAGDAPHARRFVQRHGHAVYHGARGIVDVHGHARVELRRGRPDSQDRLAALVVHAEPWPRRPPPHRHRPACAGQLYVRGLHDEAVRIAAHRDEPAAEPLADVFDRSSAEDCRPGRRSQVPEVRQVRVRCGREFEGLEVALEAIGAHFHARIR